MKKQSHGHNNTKSKSSVASNFAIALSLGFLMTSALNIIMWQCTTIEKTVINLHQDIDSYARYIKVNNSNIDIIIRASRVVDYIKAKFTSLTSIIGQKFNTSEYLGDTKTSRQAQGVFDSAYNAASSFALVIALSLGLMLMKLIAVSVSIFLYVLCSLLGFLDGLVARYKRTMQAGRESTFVFHHISKLLLSLPAFVVFIYIVSPIYISPLIVSVSIAMFLFSGFRVYGANLKKYM